ncbi:class I SAM-dependent methyltransferase [Candidiatus Paracoxiella cheracis]|uniref:class I SAM-dependent methyltransferase n=1 Tax=Candidiatus Paracoxiella cheracis TaxID=3405120 RepID=UPI003BF5126A
MNEDNLPAPDPIAKAHSDALRSQIIEEITANGPMPFARYMQLALYARALGYYSAGSQKFGAAGDFVTAPEISPLFSQCVARQCEQVLRDLTDADILELGAGSGAMALAMLQEWERRKQLPRHYYILDLSADLRDRQQRLFQTHAPHLLPKVIWLDHLPEKKIKGVIVGNEVMDAMPVHKFKKKNGIQEYYVTLKEGKFTRLLAEPSVPSLKQAIEDLDIGLPEDYESEINLLLRPWITSLSDILEQGLILLIDYGFPTREYYHPDRNTGTLMCHYRHHAHTDPFLYPGIQDITAHVDFTAVAKAAAMNKLTVAGYTHQAGFLLACGIDSMLPSVDDVESHYNFAQQVKLLTLPSEMGELFKAIALTRNYDKDLMGFSMMSQLEKL